jgi:uncharacterized repeat protein (TIGR01451 family)
MKKVINLSISFGLLAILYIIIILYPRASIASSGNPIIVGDNTRPEQAGTPWYNEAWHYRRPVTISNSGDFLPYYQILIVLDNTNFNFNLAKVDGSDIRFTDSSGKNPLLFWIESWNKQNRLAYLWVLVSSLSPEPYDTTIYLYYNNPQAAPVSENPSPFDFFDDDWCQFPGAGCGFNSSSQQLQSPFRDGKSTYPAINPLSSDMINSFQMEEQTNGYTIGSNSWITLTEMLPSVDSGILTLDNNMGIRTNNPFKFQAVGFRANYGLGNGHAWVGSINGASGYRTMIGDLPTDVDDLYLINFSNDNNAILEGVNDWHNAFHVYEIRWKAGESVGDIDHGVSTASNLLQVPSQELPVTLYNNNSGSNTMLNVDWIYVRKYRDPEPTIMVKAEQGLVKLNINNTDMPDPVRPGVKLTYQLTIHNTSTINAPGVTVTDTLPVNVQIGSVSSSQGNCLPGSVILCDLNNIPANSMASITIIVTPTIDGVITNTATVDSPSYELDLSDNTREQGTFVDSVPPVVNWERPVQNGQLYNVYGNLITLEASATDNDQVAWVEFRLWNHVANPPRWVSVGTSNTYPYQVLFDSSVLVPNQVYQMFVAGGDRAGNQSNPYNPLQRIFIERKLLVYLPLMHR